MMGEMFMPPPLTRPPLLSTRYAVDMKDSVDPTYTIAQYTTAQAAEMLTLSLPAVQSAIQRGTLASTLVGPRTRLLSQAAIDAYRTHHRGQVGQPSRQRRRALQKIAAPPVETAADTVQEGGMP